MLGPEQNRGPRPTNVSRSQTEVSELFDSAKTLAIAVKSIQVHLRFVLLWETIILLVECPVMTNDFLPSVRCKSVNL